MIAPNTPLVSSLLTRSQNQKASSSTQAFQRLQRTASLALLLSFGITTENIHAQGVADSNTGGTLTNGALVTLVDRPGGNLLMQVGDLDRYLPNAGSLSPGSGSSSATTQKLDLSGAVTRISLSGGGLILNATVESPLKSNTQTLQAPSSLAVTGVITPNQEPPYTQSIRITNGGSLDLGGAWNLPQNPSTLLQTGTVAPALEIFQQPPSVISIVKGATGVLPISTRGIMTANATTTYQLFERIPGTDNQLKALAVSGKAGKDGVMNVPLAGFPESGDYVIKVRREFPEGFASLTTQTLPFRLIVANWENAAGSYAALLSDANPAKNRPSDGASLRGAVDFTITKNGAISGRLQYNETHAHPALGSALAYKAVRRNFSGRFTPVSGEALKFVLKPKPALGGNPSGQEIIIEVDLSLSPPSVGVTVRDYASAGSSGSAGGFSSAAYGLTKTLTQAPESLSAAGAFILASDTLSTAQATDDRGYIIARVLPGANVLWLTRLPGYFGGGSAKLTENGSLKSSVFYEARTVNSASTFSTTSLLGKLRLQPSNSGSMWMANLGSSEAAGRLEKQSTRIMLTGESRGYAGARSTTGVKALEFFDNGASESPTAKNLQPPLLPAGIPMQLSVKDPSVPSVESFVWNISLSSRGTPSVSGIPRAGQFPPRLSLRLNHDSGEWTGAYTSFNGSRRLLTGVVATSARNSALHSRGWVEDAATPTQTAGWELTFPPRL